MDDLPIVGTSRHDILQIVKELQTSFPTKHLGELEYFLTLEVIASMVYHITKFLVVCFNFAVLSELHPPWPIILHKFSITFYGASRSPSLGSLETWHDMTLSYKALPPSIKVEWWLHYMVGQMQTRVVTKIPHYLHPDISLHSVVVPSLGRHRNNLWWHCPPQRLSYCYT